jgi:hypothetical protein
MKIVVAIITLLTAASASSAELSPVAGIASPAGFADPAIRFGNAIDGNRIGLWSERTSHGLRQLPNIWVAVEEKGKPLRPAPADYTPNAATRPESFLILTHPDGSVSKEAAGWPADGPVGWGWIGGIGGQLYPAIKTTGVYKVQYRLANLESGSITFTVVSDAEDFVADPRMGSLDAMRAARSAVEQTILADAAKLGYEPLFVGGRDDSDETWVTFDRKFKDGRVGKPGHGIVAYNKNTGAIRWVQTD